MDQTTKPETPPRTAPAGPPPHRAAQRVRLALATALFLAWIAWLAYLALTTTHPVVLSRPQFLVSTVDVIAEVREKDDEPDPRVKVVRVVWAKEAGDKDLEGKTIQVANLPRIGRDQGWQGPGRYILPLQKGESGKADQFYVAPIPRSPGYPRPGKNVLADRPGPPQIYRATPEAEEQLEEIESKR
jgi:hypothetical protein